MNRSRRAPWFRFLICTSVGASALLGCASSPPARRGEPDQPRTGATAASVAGCGTPQACFEAGQLADKAKDSERALSLYRMACEGGSGRGCLYLAEQVPDKLAYWKRACELGDDRFDSTGPGTGCFNAAEGTYKADPSGALGLYKKGCGQGFVDACERGARLANDQERYTDAIALAQGGCTEKTAATCGLLGALVVLGKGVDRDVEKGMALLSRGCGAGDEEACRNKKQLESNLAKLGRGPAGATRADGGGRGGIDVPGANISMGSITADGVTLNDLACRTGGGGLFGALTLGPVLAKSIGPLLPKLRSCLPGKQAVRVRLEEDSDSMASDADTPAASKCVESTFKSARAKGRLHVSGTCAVTIPLR